jgi:hypothetical protein
MNFHRSPNDLGRIAANEIAGIEPRGSLEKIISAARNDKLPESDGDIGGSAAALLKLALALQAPTAIKKQINDLATAAATASKAADSVKANKPSWKRRGRLWKTSGVNMKPRLRNS